jgi:hypothetical protein
MCCDDERLSKVIRLNYAVSVVLCNMSLGVMGAACKSSEFMPMDRQCRMDMEAWTEVPKCRDGSWTSKCTRGDNIVDSVDQVKRDHEDLVIQWLMKSCDMSRDHGGVVANT